MDTNKQKKLKNVFKESNLLTKKQICKLCFNEFSPNLLEFLYSKENISVCPKCLHNLIVKRTKFKIENISGESFYVYHKDDFTQKLLNQYKTKNDVILSDIFLYKLKYYLKLKYLGYIIVLSPSSKEAFQRRGFNHLMEILEALNLKKVSCIDKTKDVEQKFLSYDKRQNIGSVLKLNEEKEKVRNKKVLLFDDLKTTGATLAECVKLLKQIPVKKIKIVTLFSTPDIKTT